MNLDIASFQPIFKSKSKEAFEIFSSLVFPNRKQEKWKYAKLKKIKKIPFHNQHSFVLSDFDHLSLPIRSGITIVIENGKFNAKLSNISQIEGVQLIPFSDLNNLQIESLNGYKKSYNNYFSYLNHTCLEQGFFINVLDNIKVEDVVNIINISTVENILANTRLNISVGKNSSLEIKQYFIGEKNAKNSFINHLSEFYIAENGNLQIDKFQNFEENFNICSEFIKQQYSSFFAINTYSNSGQFIRNDIGVEVEGEHCHTELNGVFSPSVNEYMDQHTTIDHLVANCNSFENYKGVIRSNGIGVFNGKVIVHQDAQKIEAFQQNNNVLIDDNATIFSKPELEIYADDVKCSHGSTTGQFDEEALFYLRSRGLGRIKATEMLTIGFINEVIEKASGENYKSFILKNLLNK